jgi:uncharacterized coiled-coil DUF342 family protein
MELIMEKTVTTNEYKKTLDTWKADYKDLSKRIREMKAARKQYVWKGRRPRIQMGHNPNYDSIAQWRVETLRDEARRMMAKRIELKIQAQEYAKNRD